MKIRPANDAFTLVELAIVLAIIGVLAGGITVGASLIQRAKINHVMIDITKYGTAIMKFQQQYQAVPGDYVDATEQWGTASLAPATCVTTPSTGTETCNGNGDNAVNNSAGSNEIFRFWQHLANAGLIEGRYNGVAGPSVSYNSTPDNSPQGKLDNSGWFIYSWGSVAVGNSTFFPGFYDNTMTFGGFTPGSWAENPLLTAKDTYQMDMKADDGAPATGKMRVLYPTNCTNDSTGTNVNATYSIGDNTAKCVPIWPMITSAGN